MMRNVRGADRWARGIGVVLGIVVVGFVFSNSRVQNTGGRLLGADVTFATGPTGELGVTPAGPFVQGLALRPTAPEDADTGSVEVRNQTGTPLAVRIAAEPSINDLDDVLYIRVEAGASRLYRGPLERLRDWTKESFTLRSGQTTKLEVATWIPPSIQDGYAGRIADVGIQFQVEPAGHGRGAEVAMTGVPNARIGVTPGSFVHGRGLKPSSPDKAVTGTAEVRNQTGSALAVKVRAVPSVGDLDEILYVLVTVDDKRIFRGPLGRLHQWSRRSFPLSPDQTAALAVATWVQPSVTDGFVGRSVQVDVHFQAMPVGG